MASGIFGGLQQKVDTLRGISPEARRRIRLESARRRMARRASGPAHAAEIDAIFMRALEDSSPR